MSQKIKVSVTIPTYNAERFIAQAIKSVLQQDHPFFELIILDDGSKDKTKEIIKRYTKDSRVRFYSQKNKGLGAARKRLDKLAKGKYISPLDADDIMLAGKLKIQAEYLDKHPPIGVVYGKALFIDENGKRIKASQMKSTVGEYFGIDITRTWDLLFSAVPFGSCMYRKELLLKAGGYESKLRIATDIDIFLKLAEVTRFHFIDKPFYIYRRHNQNISKDKSRMQEEILTVKKMAVWRRYAKDKGIEFC